MSWVNLPPEIADHNEVLQRYCDIRIAHFELLIKAISEDSDAYEDEFAVVVSDLEDMLDELNASQD